VRQCGTDRRATAIWKRVAIGDAQQAAIVIVVIVVAIVVARSNPGASTHVPELEATVAMCAHQHWEPSRRAAALPGRQLNRAVAPQYFVTTGGT
jgi:hypothetical protein